VSCIAHKQKCEDGLSGSSFFFRVARGFAVNFCLSGIKLKKDAAILLFGRKTLYLCTLLRRLVDFMVGDPQSDIRTIHYH